MEPMAGRDRATRDPADEQDDRTIAPPWAASIVAASLPWPGRPSWTAQETGYSGDTAEMSDKDAFGGDSLCPGLVRLAPKRSARVTVAPAAEFAGTPGWGGVLDSGRITLDLVGRELRLVPGGVQTAPGSAVRWPGGKAFPTTAACQAIPGPGRASPKSRR